MAGINYRREKTMKDKEIAIEKAEFLWMKYGKTFHVVFSPDEKDIAGNNYHISDDDDLEGFYAGCPIIVTYES
jgi:hypothetical protein